MPRVRADDYDDKKSKILDAGARLFAEFGYDGSKMETIAERCGVSKSMLYHYFAKKEDVLFDILQEHVSRLISDLEEYFNTTKLLDKAEFFRGFVEVYLEKSKDARARHVVALHDMRYLTDKQKKIQVKLERELLRLMTKVLHTLDPNQAEEECRVAALLLVGMMNWIELWYHRTGRLSPAELYDKVNQLFLFGFLKDA